MCKVTVYDIPSPIAAECKGKGNVLLHVCKVLSTISTHAVSL